MKEGYVSQEQDERAPERGSKASMSSKIRGVALFLLPEIKNGIEQNKPEYKELFHVFGVHSQTFSCLILATGRNKGKLDVEGIVFVEGGYTCEKENLYTQAKFTTSQKAATFTVIGGVDKNKMFALNCETSELARGRRS